MGSGKQISERCKVKFEKIYKAGDENEKYLKAFRNTSTKIILSSVEKLQMRRQWILQEDNDPKHEVKSTQEPLYQGLPRLGPIMP